MQSQYASSSSAAVQEPPPYTDEDAKALFRPAGGIPAYVQPLPLPMCLPQVSTGIDAPFARAYSPQLAASGIQMDDWLKFVDGLNMAFVASPPLRVIDAAGMVIGLVPYHWAMIASIAMCTSAQVGARALSKSLTDRYMRNANADYFIPRGMRVRLCKTAAMRQIIGMDTVSAEPPNKFIEGAKGFGRGLETVAMHLPIASRIVTRLHPASAPVDERMGSDFASRRIASIKGYTLPLDFNVPPPEPQSGAISQVQGLGVKLSQWQNARANAKASHKRQILAISQGGYDAQGLANQGGRDGRKAQRAVRKYERATARGKVPRESRRMKMKVAVEDKKEENNAGGILWLVVISAEQDKLIQGLDIIDSKADVEEISDSEWEEEIELEREEDAYDLKEKGDDVNAL